MAFKMKKFSGFGKGSGKQTPMNFNAGLRKASREGKLDNNPKFKAAVDNAPMKIVDKVKKRVKKVKEGVSNVLRKGDQFVSGIGNPQYRKYLKEQKKKAAEKKLKDVNEFN